MDYIKIILSIYFAIRYVIYIHDSMHASRYIFGSTATRYPRASIISLIFLGWITIWPDLFTEFKAASKCLSDMWRGEKDDWGDGEGNLANHS